MARTPSAQRRLGFGLRISRRDSDVQRDQPVVPWVGAAVLGGVVAAAAGYVLALGLSTLAWFSATDIGYGVVASVAARLWLLAHGAAAPFGGVTVSIAPLGFTLLLAFIAAGIAGFAAGQGRIALWAEESDAVTSGTPVLTPDIVRRRGLQVAALFTAGYVLTVAVPAAVFVQPDQATRAGLGALAVGLLSSLVGVVRGLGLAPAAGWPAWLRAVPLAVAGALLVLTAGGALLTGLALTEHWRRVAALTQSLHAGVLGGVLLLLLQLSYLPNVVAWSTSWTLGAGFTLGQGTLISPVQTQSGLLPAVPLLAGLPANGSGGAGLWWLACGVAAGAVAAVIVALARRRARFDEVALVGALAGVVSAGCLLVLVWLTGGDAGTGRLVGFGPRMLPLAVMATTTLGLSGLVTGLVIGLVRSPVASDPAVAGGGSVGVPGPRPSVGGDGGAPGDTL